MPDIDAMRDDYDIVRWATEPGDCLVFGASVVHQGRANVPNDARRRAVINRWVGDDGTYAIRTPPAEYPLTPPKDVRHSEPIRTYEGDFPMVWTDSGSEKGIPPAAHGHM